MTASLLVAGVSGSAQADPEPAATPTGPVSTTFPRPEDPDAPLRAAIQEAKKRNAPVAVETAYTETSRTWAYPDGHLTTQSYAGPSQLKQVDGSWAWIDTTLVEKDGVLKPKLAKADVRFSQGGNGPFASLERDKGQRFALSWLKDLPRPRIEGNVATYIDAAGPGADLVLTALPDGFRHDVILRERPSEPMEIRIPVETDKLTFSKAKDGMLKLADSSGATVAQAPAPVMTEASASAPEVTAGSSQRQAQPAGKITTRVEKVGKGKSTLVLTPDPAWLADPATQYPVVVDPTTTLTLQSDFYLYYYCGNSSIMTGDKLWVGSSLSSCAPTQPVSHLRTYLDFDTTALVGRAVGSAQLDLYATGAFNGCSYTGALKVSRLTSDWGTGSGTVPVRNWANKPKVAEAGSQLQVCPAYNQVPRAVSWNIKDIANAWATGATDYGLQIRGGNEIQDASAGTPGWVEFDSSYKVGGRPPKLTVTYMLPPEIPTVTAESIDSLDGTDAVARAQNVKVGFKSSVAEATNLDYTVTVNESTMTPPPTAPTGHMAHWKFDEASGAATAADASGNGYTATYSGSRRKSVPGKLGSAIELNDMTGSNGCCVPDSYATTSRAVLSQNSSFSISAWVKLKNSDTIQYVASQDGDPFGLGLYYLSTSQKWRLQVSGTGGSSGYGVWVDTTQPVRTDAWTHVVALHDAAAGKIRLYVDGALSAEADYQPSSTVISGPFRIGSRKGDSGLQYLQGAIDDMRLYQRALTAKEVKDLYGEVSATSYNAKPSGQVIEQTFELHNPASLKFVVKACRTGVTPPSCSESPAYRITSDAAMLPTNTETDMTDPTQPILSGTVNRPSGRPVSAKYYLYDSTGAPVGAAPLGVRTVPGGERASYQLPAGTVQPGTAYTWQMRACVGDVSTAPDPDPTPTPTPTPTLSADLKARWAFDEGTGSTAADSSGNNRPVTLTGATWATGKSQSGLQLSGTSASYGVTSEPAINTDAGYTVSAWAKIDNTTADHAIISQDGAVNSAFKLAYSPGDQKWRMVTYQTDTTGATPLRALSTANAVANQWAHLVGVYDAAAGKIRLYVNGVLNAETTFTSTWNATSNIQIGRTKANGTLTNYLKGTIDEVRLYQKALTATEIAALYANPAQAVAVSAQTPSATGPAGPAAEATASSGTEVCTAKTAPLSFTTTGTPPPTPPSGAIHEIMLGSENIIVRTAQTGVDSCGGQPCPFTDSATVQFGGPGSSHLVSALKVSLAELPAGSVPVDATLLLKDPSCEGSPCSAAVEVRLTPLSGEVSSSIMGSDVQGAIEIDPAPVGPVPADGLQIDATPLLGWIAISSDSEQTVEFGGSTPMEAKVRYRLPTAPGPISALQAAGASKGAVFSWHPPTDPGSLAIVDDYDVQVTDANGQVVQTRSVQGTYADVTDLTAGASYTIAVRAKSPYGEGPWTSVEVAVPAPPANACDDPETFSRAIVAFEESRNQLRELAADSVEDITTGRDTAASKAILFAQQPNLAGVARTLDERGIRQTASSTGVTGVMLFHDQAGGSTTAQAQVSQTFEYLGDIGTANPEPETNQTEHLKTYTFSIGACDRIQVRDSSDDGRLVSVTPDMNEVPTGPGSIPADGMDLPIDSDGFPELPIDDAFAGQPRADSSAASSAGSGLVNRAAAAQWAVGHYLDETLFGNDCTNFVSRALHYGGGAAMDTNGKQPTDADRRDASQWFQSKSKITWYNSWAVRAATSWSWSGANSFFQHFMVKQRRATWVTSWKTLRVGDVLLFDYSGGSPDFGHVAIVSRIKSGSWKGVEYAQHSSPYDYRPLAISLPAVKKNNPNINLDDSRLDRPE
ncbi:LamG-like jellyroll fold domain-containing protein [Nonomuraea sp. MTCD27]|uniref:LamG-like jellyroll fold domain-containing protein n=1 Tax=Nonomuraea sp. MTCD27 TaxID=1676747 RepID=UPI0035C2219D